MATKTTEVNKEITRIIKKQKKEVPEWRKITLLERTQIDKDWVLEKIRRWPDSPNISELYINQNAKEGDIREIELYYEQARDYEKERTDKDLKPGQSYYKPEVKEIRLYVRFNSLRGKELFDNRMFYPFIIEGIDDFNFEEDSEVRNNQSVIQVLNLRDHRKERLCLLLRDLGHLLQYVPFPQEIGNKILSHAKPLSDLEKSFYAKLVDLQDDIKIFEELLAIAKQLHSGEIEKVGLIFGDASDTRNDAIFSLAERCNQLGMWQKALEVLEHITDPTSRNHHYYASAWYLRGRILVENYADTNTQEAREKLSTGISNLFSRVATFKSAEIIALNALTQYAGASEDFVPELQKNKLFALARLSSKRQKRNLQLLQEVSPEMTGSLVVTPIPEQPKISSSSSNVGIKTDVSSSSSNEGPKSVDGEQNGKAEKQDIEKAIDSGKKAINTVHVVFQKSEKQGGEKEFTGTVFLVCSNPEDLHKFLEVFDFPFIQPLREAYYGDSLIGRTQEEINQLPDGVCIKNINFLRKEKVADFLNQIPGLSDQSKSQILACTKKPSAEDLQFYGLTQNITAENFQKTLDLAVKITEGFGVSKSQGFEFDLFDEVHSAYDRVIEEVLAEKGVSVGNSRHNRLNAACSDHFLTLATNCCAKKLYDQAFLALSKIPENNCYFKFAQNLMGKILLEKHAGHFTSEDAKVQAEIEQGIDLLKNSYSKPYQKLALKALEAYSGANTAQLIFDLYGYKSLTNIFNLADLCYEREREYQLLCRLKSLKTETEKSKNSRSKELSEGEKPSLLPLFRAIFSTGKNMASLLPVMPEPEQEVAKKIVSSSQTSSLT